MKPPVDTIRLGKQSRDQLVKIKRNTGIENWNIICRFALCASLREPTPPPSKKASTDGGVEIAWKVFAGNQSEVFCALIQKDLLEKSKSGYDLDANQLVHAHITRGLGYLSSGSDIRQIETFVTKWLGAQLTL